MSFKSTHDQDDEMSEINMTPLVDVMLVLLTIFIVTVPVITHQITVKLPKTQSSASQTPPKTIALQVMAAGQITWNEQLIDDQELKQRCAALATVEPQPIIQLYGDENVAYGKVINVMAIAKQAGVNQISFVTVPAK
ncbi:MAG: biopolymer transporter ExbD [Halothiobacillus sp. 20-53-49]|nr:MAG: biopolymer transporter ExbD [Halothiobacillus sp. 20-53-49]